MNFKFDEIPCFVTVSRTFQSEKFQEILKKIDELNIKENLLVVDECHHYNKLSAIGKLPEFINHRVGLSATLYDKYIYDENGKEDESKIFLTKYFKKIVISYKLEDAIREKNLVPYNYKLIPIKLNDFEIDDLNEISEEISRQFAIKENGESNKDNDKSLQYNLAKRASLLASASEKIIKLKNLLTQISPIKNTLIYCGTTIEEDQTDYEKQIDKVQKILFKDFNIRSSRVTADETATQRDDIIDRFTKRNIDALVSIRVLDEGIDIPSCQQAIILASDKSDRQFIQRRGRVLRRDDAGGKKEANIYDFVIIGGTKKSVHLDKQISDEIFRVKEFASLALNKDDIYNEFKHLLNEN
jgi:superfamily II DNA or RNA helicase